MRVYFHALPIPGFQAYYQTDVAIYDGGGLYGQLDFLLLEDGFFILLEDFGKIIIDG